MKRPKPKIVNDGDGSKGNPTPRIFLSYSQEDKDIAGALKQYLGYFGMKAFLAHEDIEPGKKWTRVILSELASCDLFVPVTTPSAKGSLYVNQEIGFALAMKKEILPFKFGADPFGFISETQGMKPPMIAKGTILGATKVIDYAASALFVAEKMLFDVEFGDGLRESVIRGLLTSGSWEETNCKIRVLDELGKLTSGEVETIATAAIENKEVYDSFKARAYLRKFLKEYEDSVTDEIKGQIENRINRKRVLAN